MDVLCSKTKKANLRRLSKHYVARSGRHRAERVRNSENEYREVLFIGSPDEQKSIISNIHMVCGDCDPAHCLGSHLGVDRTRVEIFEMFYRKNVAKDTKEFVFSCDRCHKANPVHKINAGAFHPVPVPNEVMVQTGVDSISLPKTDYGYCCCNG
ncbi:Hypothetical predicted protein [Octopus vulgaris]|uniref:Integrase zinc-binding domain-containing protein n=1 Tax=Octopus vulgaris TaxID=6645 RepID=A0AA36BDF6_OCTVU|nr:Hypothetical predicted protein [Octopus vulgaris]